MNLRALLIFAPLLLVAPAGMALAAGDAAKGKQAFAKCAACHKVDASGTSGIGPNLNRVVGRASGTLAGYRYSPARSSAKRVWTEAALDAYLAAPAKSIPGNKMPFAGIADKAERQNVIAYLRSAAK